MSDQDRDTEVEQLRARVELAERQIVKLTDALEQLEHLLNPNSPLRPAKGAGFERLAWSKFRTTMLDIRTSQQ